MKKYSLKYTIKKKIVALINQENGLDNLEIEFPGTELVESLITRKIPLNEFVDLISQAIKKLKGD